jgi:hypothetical protein
MVDLLFKEALTPFPLIRVPQTIENLIRRPLLSHGY